MGTRELIDWHARLDHALDARQKKQVDLVRLCEVEPATVSDWISGKTKMLGAKYGAKVCTYLSISPDWLFEGRLPSGLEEDLTSIDELPGVNVIGYVRGGKDGYYVEMDIPPGGGSGFIRYPMRDPNTYALRVRGDSMRPRVKPGEFIVVEPNHSYAIGDDVMVKMVDEQGTERAMVKVLSRHSAGEYEFRSINENEHPPITVEEKNVKEIHYIGAITKPSWYYERS